MGDHALRLALLLAAICVLGLPSSASAAFPGTNGRIAFVSDRDGSKEIYSADSNGAGPLRLTANIVADTDPAYSPDGTKIAFARGLDIWVMNADGSGQAAITGMEGPDSEPAWSADGSQIVYVSNHSTSGGGTTGPELFVKNADGSGTTRQVTDTPIGASRAPAWAPGGAEIAYESSSDGTFEIYAIAASTTAGTGTRRSPNEISKQYQNPSWSPDGARIAYERGDGTNIGDATKDVWTMKADGTDFVQLTTNAFYDVQPAYSPDGTQVAFESNADGDREIHTMAATAGATPNNITNTTSGITDEQPDWGDFVPPPPPPPGDGGNGGGTGGGDGGGGTGTTPEDEGPTPTCQEKASFGVVEIVGCLQPFEDGWRTTGTVWLNGLGFVPAGDAQLILNRKQKTLRSVNGVFSLWGGKNLLHRGPIDWDLTPVGGVVRALLGAQSTTKFGKLPARGPVLIRLARTFEAFVDGAAEMPFMDELQRLCGTRCPSVTADVTMITDNKTGLQHEGLKISARNILLGGAAVKKFDATWDPTPDRWEGSAALAITALAAPDIKVNWITEAGRIVSVTAHERDVRLPFYWGVALQGLDFSLTRNPLQIAGQLELTGGPTILGRPALGASGGFIFQPGVGGVGGALTRNAGRLHLDGQTRVLSFRSDGFLDLWPSGALDFGLRVDLGLPLGYAEPRRAPIYVGASLAGWLARSSFGAEGSTELRLFGVLATRAEMVMSNIGWAACGQLGWLRGGLAEHWGDRNTSIMGGSCDVGPYRGRKTARAAQGGPLTLQLRDSSRGAVLRFRGNGGAPRVILEGPEGQRVAAPSDGSPVVNSNFVVLEDANESATHVAIRKPGGTWRVTLAEGSPSIAGVDSADVLEQPAVAARVGGSGSKRTLAWKLKRIPGQQVTFVETGADSAHVIKKTSATRGTTRFAPAPGNARARKIVAIVEQAGAPRATLNVARYKAPPWQKPKRPPGLRARRKGSSLVVSWRPAAGAARYMVFVTSADGDRQVFLTPARKRRLKVKDVQPADRALVKVAGMRSDDAPGAASTLRLKPVKRR